MGEKLHQVFIGCPFKKDIRNTYEKLKRQLEDETPLHLVLADTATITRSDYLLEHITTLIRESAGCIFDVTGGNPNVSLEVGIAHALPADYVLAMKTRRPRKAASHEFEVRPIISDLQGKIRIEYKTNIALKEDIESRYLRNLPFMGRWERFKSRNGEMVPYALKLFAEMRTSGRSQRPRLRAILEGSGFAASQVVAELTRHRLIVSRKGARGGYFYPTR